MKNHNTIENEDAMSGNEPTGARRRRRTKVAVWLGVAGLCAGGASLVPVGGATTQATTGPMSEGMLCNNGDTGTAGHTKFSLIAQDGYTSEPDGNAIYDWSYGQPGSGFQLPGPVLCVYQGTTVDITLTNNLLVATSIQFPGQTGVTADGQPDGPVPDGSGNLLSLAKEAGANGGSVTYSFVATTAGTYVYESGSDPQLQVQMGLFGALVVRPSGVTITGADILGIPFEDGVGTGQTNGNGGGVTAGAADAAALHAGCAYPSLSDPTKCDPDAIYDSRTQVLDGNQSVDRGENILMLSEVDPGLHTFMEQAVQANDTTKLSWNAYPNAYATHYFMINGRSMPDTVAPNNAPWLPTQPYGSLAHVQPWDPIDNPLDVMLRYVAVGTAGYDFHPHSNHEHVIAQDGALMKTQSDDNTEGKFNILVNPGTTVDATFRWTNQEGYTDSANHRVPVAWPNGLNMLEGDFWSGSPYLGSTGELNPGIVTKTQCGEYYHVAHNHDLTEVTNYGITFGGMLTLIKVEPPTSVQGTRQGDFIVPKCD